jgi:hypothetical protein
LPAGLRRLRAELTHRDDMPADKVAWAAVPSPIQRHVLLVSAGNFYLETALALDTSIALQVVPPVAYTDAMGAKASAVVFDSFVPPTLPQTSALLVNPPQSTVLGATVGQLIRGGPAKKARGAPKELVRYVDLSDVTIAATNRVKLPSWMRPVVLSGTETAVAAGEHVGRRIVLAAFRLQNSDWPLRVSFPVFLHNALEYLSPGATLGATTVEAGAPVRLFGSPGTQSLEITRPDGSTTSINRPFPPFTDTSQAGIYSVRPLPNGTSGYLFAANSLPPERTDRLLPAQSRLGVATHGSTGTVQTPISVAWVVALAVLGLLTAEWWLGMRR